MYVPLHVHTDFSLLDGVNTPTDIANRLTDLGIGACAITDHGSISGAVDFTEKMEENGIKPILGCEFYVFNKDQKVAYHQVVLARNLEGWKQLLELVSESNLLENFYKTPRISLQRLLEAGRSGNLITFSGHLGSVLSGCMEHNGWDINVGIQVAEAFRAAYGDRFYLEVQIVVNPENETVKKNADMVRAIASKLNIPTVATPDAHYSTRKDAIYQRILVCSLVHKTLDEVYYNIKHGTEKGFVKGVFQTDGLHIPSPEEMRLFHTDEELKNTQYIADSCDNFSILHPPSAPTFECPDGLNETQYLRRLCQQNLPQDPRYKERLEYELNVFESVGLSGYFLIIMDILNFVRSHGGLTGVGRGSSAGCLVSYLIGITQVDPIRYNLLFERFYNAGRNAPGKISWPDIDFDVPREFRGRVLEYLQNKYSKSKVGQIITFQTLKGRAALTKVFSAYGLPFYEQKQITKHIIAEHKIAGELDHIKEKYGRESSILWCLENRRKHFEDVCQLDDDGKLTGKMADMFQTAINLEGKKISSSKHAAGIIVSKEPISHSCPMVLDKDKTQALAGFEGPACEKVGLLKLDCLGLAALDKLMCARELINAEE